MDALLIPRFGARKRDPPKNDVEKERQLNRLGNVIVHLGLRVEG
jgi:hypothetical protein